MKTITISTTATASTILAIDLGKYKSVARWYEPAALEAHFNWCGCWAQSPCARKHEHEPRLET
jgi:hypothetical protein